MVSFGVRCGTILASFLESIFGLISGIVLGPFWIGLGPGWGPSLSPNGERMQIVWFLETRVSPTRNGRFGGQGVPKSVQEVRKTRSENRCGFVQFVGWLLVGFGMHFGPQNQSKVYQEIDRIPESVLGGVFLIQSDGGGVNMLLSHGKSKVWGINVSKKSCHWASINGVCWGSF